MITWAEHLVLGETDRYMIVRKGPHIPMTVELDAGLPKEQAQKMARDLNREYARTQARRADQDRPGRIPAGFYSDKDAA